MTVNYNLCVSTSSPWSIFKLLFRWKGSIWKAVVAELVVWLVLYTIINLIYKYALDENYKVWFELLAKWSDTKLDYIPLNFMLGFFVTVVVNRWGILFNNIGLIETLALRVAGHVKGTDEATVITRRNIVRYSVLAQILVFRDISVQVRNRFPTLETIIAAGFMLPHEKDKLDELVYQYGKTWMPFQWAVSLLRIAREEGKITHDVLLDKCVEEVLKFRSNLSILTNYDWVPIPIMYPQLMFLAVYAYFTIALFARQIIPTEDGGSHMGIFVLTPFMTVMQFLFYMGWLKVAEALLNPLGEDDDDFECNFLIDRNLTVGLTIVDECYHDPPTPSRDSFWNEPIIQPLYSEQSAARSNNPLRGSAAAMELPDDVQEVTMVSLPTDDDNKRPTQQRRVSVVGVKRGTSRASQSSSISEFVTNLRRRFSKRKTSTTMPEDGGKQNNGVYDRQITLDDEVLGPSRKSTLYEEHSPGYIRRQLHDVQEDSREIDEDQNLSIDPKNQSIKYVVPTIQRM